MKLKLGKHKKSNSKGKARRNIQENDVIGKGKKENRGKLTQATQKSELENKIAAKKLMKLELKKK